MVTEREIELREKLNEILENIDNYKEVLIEYKIVGLEKYSYEIYVLPVGKGLDWDLFLEIESPIEDIVAKRVIGEFIYKFLDKAEERAEKFLMEYIQNKFPGATIKDIEIIRRSRYRAIRVEFEHNGAIYEAKLRSMREGKEAKNGEIVMYYAFVLTPSEEDIEIEKLT